MPKIRELFPLERLRAGFGPPQPQQGRGGFQQRPQGQQRPPGAFGQQKLPMGQQQQMQMDPMQIAEQIALAVGRLQSVLKMAKPGQEQQTDAAKKMLRIAHTKRLSGDHEAAMRHLQNAHTVLDGVETKMAPLPKALTYKDLDKRNRRKREFDQMRQARTQAKVRQATQPPQKRPFGRV